MATAHYRGDPVSGLGRHHVRLLTFWISGSVAVHALLGIVLPGVVEREAPHGEPLQVTIERLDVPREQPPAAAPTPPRRAARPVPAPTQRASPAPSEPAANTPAAPSLVLMPQQSSAPEPSLAVRAPEMAGEPQRDAPQVAALAPPPERPAPAKARPSISDAYALESSVRYPRTAEHGRVTMKVLVGRDGRVASVSMEKTSGYANLDQHALQVVKRWRFAPARQDSEAVEQWLTVNIDY